MLRRERTLTRWKRSSDKAWTNSWRPVAPEAPRIMADSFSSGLVSVSVSVCSGRISSFADSVLLAAMSVIIVIATIIFSILLFAAHIYLFILARFHSLFIL